MDGKSETTRRSYPLDEDFVTGFDVPDEPWSAETVAFWTGTVHYQPWKDVAAFFREDQQQHGQ